MTEVEQISRIIADNHKFLVIQADNPDADSLASALALEQILHEMGKEPILYCGIDMPEYLRYLPGWDRVDKEIPTQFDVSIIVDTSTMTLLEKLSESGAQGWVASKPVIVLDHHTEVANDISFATITINDKGVVSTGELIYKIAGQLDWPVSVNTAELLVTSILADSMGLATENTTPETYRAMANLIELGVNRPKLEELRRQFNKMPETIFRYKAELMQRTELINNVAIVTIPQNEINEYSPLYNPAPLVQGDHLQVAEVLVSVVLKHYDTGRITGAIRCNQGAPIAAELAASLGGGGHAYAAGFKLEGKQIEDVKKQVIVKIQELLK